MARVNLEAKLLFRRIENTLALLVRCFVCLSLHGIWLEKASSAVRQVTQPFARASSRLAMISFPGIVYMITVILFLMLASS